jgi:hypothetical protein
VLRLKKGLYTDPDVSRDRCLHIFLIYTCLNELPLQLVQ